MSAARRGDERRGSAAERGYGAAWQRLRLAVLKAEPLCRRCRERGVVRAATLVHHMDRIAEGNPALARVERLVPMCDECHAVEHAQAQHKTS